MTREEAIKRLKSDIYEYSDFTENPNENEFWTAFDMAIKALEAPPNDNWEGYSKRLWKSAYERGKADAEQRWIPVSERLPEKDGFYLATCDGEICGEDDPISCMAEFENGKWVDDEDDYQCVLAWMPLPQPYKAESEDIA